MAVPAFTAPRWLRNAHLQTLYGSAFAPRPEVAYRRERWETPDGDFIDVDFCDGAADAPFVVMFHGLEGSSDSGYARALMREALDIGWRGAVVNFRGCSGEPNRLARAYHSGDSEEVNWILRTMRARLPGVALYAAGMSLGGNALLKWVGERSSDAVPIIDAAAGASAPVDLMASGESLGRGFNRIYTKHFLGTMKKRSVAKLARFPGIFDADAALRARNLREFDDVVTAPLHGYKDTDDYWTRGSAKPHMTQIRVPTLLVSARDDPFLDAPCFPLAREISRDVTLDFPAHGGHGAFVSGKYPGDIRWLARRILHFFQQQE